MLTFEEALTCPRHKRISQEVPLEAVAVWIEHLLRCVIFRRTQTTAHHR